MSAGSSETPRDDVAQETYELVRALGGSLCRACGHQFTLHRDRRSDSYEPDLDRDDCAECPCRSFLAPLDVHTFFGLSYAAYLVVNRSLLQSMPIAWQYRFTAVMEELWDHFGNIDEPNYVVQCRNEHGRFVADPIPHYNRGRTHIVGGPRVFECSEVPS